MRMNVFVIFIVVVAICFVLNAHTKWYDCEWSVSDLVKSACGWTIFVCLVYFIFM